MRKKVYFIKFFIFSGNETTEPEMLTMLNESAYQNEKNQLIAEVYKMRDLLSQLNKSESVDTKEWRNELLNTVSSIFSDHREYLLAELRTFVINNSYSDQQKQISHLEGKVYSY